MNNFQYFDIAQSINDKRDIKGIILDNDIKIVLISDKTILDSCCSIAINSGYLQDEYEGTAHFLEHLLFMGSEKFPEQNEYHSYVSVCGGMDNAFTGDNITCYYLELESNFMNKGIEMLSWFFKKPLLDMKSIKSELDIINSEHDKNILSDSWIMDDIFKKFILPSKYTKFGTGNNISLKNISRDDILNYYKNYYTTDNIYICIVDTKTIDEMMNDYLKYFIDIQKTKMKKNLKNDNLQLIPENLIIYKSISKYNYLNLLLYFDCKQQNQNEFQLINFINYLLGIEYNKSLSYYLIENELIKNYTTSIDYFYDDKALLNINIVLVNDELKNIDEIYLQFLKYLDILKKFNKDDFKLFYKTFLKINLLSLLNSDTNYSSSEIANEVVDNMMNGELKNAILKKYLVSEYDDEIMYDLYQKMLNNVIIKITTNVNINKQDNKYNKSKWYNTEYYISEYINNSKMINNFNYEIKNIIGIKNFKIETNIIFKKINKKEMPNLIYRNECKEIYLLETNKYEKLICSINVIRKNIKLLDKKNDVIISLYIKLCNRIINYYLETMKLYCMNFSISTFNEYIIYSYIGLNYQIDNFIIELNKMLNNIFINENIEKYFLEIKRDVIENLKNFKYNSPHVLCLSYLKILLGNSLKPNEKIDLIENLSFQTFKDIIMNECLIYDYEYYLMIGIQKNKNSHNIFNDMIINKNDTYNFKDDDYLNNIINILSINKQFYKKNITIDLQKYDVNINYTLDKNEINQDEINNCVIQYQIVYNKNYKINNEYNEKYVYDILKNKIIFTILAQLLNEPLFDKIRTIDKLGYIVKCNYMYKNENDNYIIALFYLIQSNYKIEKIHESINNFNKFMLKDIKDNYELYYEKFNSLKKSKLLEFKKLSEPNYNLLQEMSTYIDSFLNKIFIFNVNYLLYKICKKITFTDIINNLNNILNKNSTKCNIILQTNK